MGLGRGRDGSGPTRLLVSQRQAGQACLLDGGLEILGEQLLLLVECVSGSLARGVSSQVSTSPVRMTWMGSCS